MSELDDFFDSILHDKLVFDIGEVEIDFIQTGVENLVKRIVDTIDSEGYDSKKRILNDFRERNPHHHFPCHGDVFGNKIIKVGSFYEKTKIIYPDEFDFIYVLCTFNTTGSIEESKWKDYYLVFNDFHDDIKRIISEQFGGSSLIKKSENDDGRCISFYGYDKVQGPSSKLTFLYKRNKEDRTCKKISVDLVPAFQIFDQHLKEREVCFMKGFADKVIEGRSYLITNEISFTETEVLFMNRTLSKKHHQSYKILKYLVNGSGDGDILRRHVPSAGISTYMIKVSMIKHHFECMSTGCYSSECVLVILRYLYNFCLSKRNNLLNNKNILQKSNGRYFTMNTDALIATIQGLRHMIRALDEHEFHIWGDDNIDDLNRGRASVNSISSLRSIASANSRSLDSLSQYVLEEIESLSLQSGHRSHSCASNGSYFQYDIYAKQHSYSDADAEGSYCQLSCYSNDTDSLNRYRSYYYDTDVPYVNVGNPYGAHISNIPHQQGKVSVPVDQTSINNAPSRAIGQEQDSNVNHSSDSSCCKCVIL